MEILSNVPSKGLYSLFQESSHSEAVCENSSRGASYPLNGPYSFQRFLSKVPFKGSFQRFLSEVAFKRPLPRLLSKVPFKGCFQTSLSKVAFKGSFQRFLPEAKHIPFQRFPLCAPLKGSIQGATCHSRVVFLSCLSKNCYCHKWRRSRALVKLKSKRSILQHSHRRQ